ncbi:hypothetical protein HDV01_006253 [Terramyces sp. JEL0728]|nr:hypothetical protein HDV01_006253 [Terramyces sp. JEL0728]
MEKVEKLKIAKKKLQEFRLTKSRKGFSKSSADTGVDRSNADNISIESDGGTGSIYGIDHTLQLSFEMPNSSMHDTELPLSEDKIEVLELMLNFKDSELQEAKVRIDELENLLASKEKQLKSQESAHISSNIIDTVKVAAHEVFQNIREVVQEVVEEDQEDFSEEPEEQMGLDQKVEETHKENDQVQHSRQGTVTELEKETLVSCLKFNTDEIFQLKHTIAKLQNGNLEELRQIKKHSDHQEHILRSKIERLERELALARINNAVMPYNLDNMELSVELNLEKANHAKSTASGSLLLSNIDMQKKIGLLYTIFHLEEPFTNSSFEKLLQILNEILKEWIRIKADLEEAHQVIEMQHLKIIEALDKQETQKLSRLTMIKAVSMEFTDETTFLDQILAELKEHPMNSDPAIQKLLVECDRINQVFTQLRLKLAAKSDRLDFQLGLNAEMKKLFITNAISGSPIDVDFNVIGKFNEAKIEVGRLQELLISNDISY